MSDKLIPLTALLYTEQVNEVPAEGYDEEEDVLIADFGTVAPCPVKHNQEN